MYAEKQSNEITYLTDINEHHTRLVSTQLCVHVLRYGVVLGTARGIYNRITVTFTNIKQTTAPYRTSGDRKPAEKCGGIRRHGSGVVSLD